MSEVNVIDINWPDLFKPIRGLKAGRFNRVRINREVIPIIFVPGIMGSRLRNSFGQSVWDPDREIMCMLRKYGGFWNTPAQRKRMLIGDTFHSDYLKADERDQEHNKKFYSFLDPTRADRGWGGVYWGSYGKFLELLQNHNWDTPLRTDGNKKNQDVVGKCFEFPVYAFGYNWTDSNLNSGKKLASRIAEVIAWYNSKGRMCRYVILVSHSMGGLVCRSACMLHGAEKTVLGVIHGVQPATGAAAAYWRMKAGFERTGGNPGQRLAGKASAWVLGTNGEEVTCILGNAPGGLELLPNQHYTDNNGEHGWLCIPGKGGKQILLPRHRNPYKEIYLATDVYWRLINPDWLNPTEDLTKPTSSLNDAPSPWDVYVEQLEKAEKSHTALQASCHKSTYQFYSSELKTIDKVEFTREKVPFQKLNLPSDFGFQPEIETTQPLIKSSNRGSSIMYVNYCDQEVKPPLTVTTHLLSMSKSVNWYSGGDGTVPESSGNALKRALSGYRLRGVEHQAAFGDSDAITYTLRAVRDVALSRIRECISAL